MRTIVKALEMYKVAHGEYPVHVATSEAAGWEVSSGGSGGFLSALVSQDSGVSNIPVDPTNTTRTGAAGTGFRSPNRSIDNNIYFYHRYNAGANSAMCLRVGITSWE